MVKNLIFRDFWWFLSIFAIFQFLKKVEKWSKSSKSSNFEVFWKPLKKRVFWGSKFFVEREAQIPRCFVEQEATASHSTKTGVDPKILLSFCGTLGCLKPRTKSWKNDHFLAKSWKIVKKPLSWRPVLCCSMHTPFFVFFSLFFSLTFHTHSA